MTGNTTVDYIGLSDFQKTVGKETIRYVASAWAEDDEVVRIMSYREINAPYFFSWHYDLVAKIEKLKLKEEGILSDEFEKIRL
ncbi:hypothetical protein [Chitinophaga filiformis]|uniref:Uncharacterized protein n=1 Tax=Chitinophaga filiformis TaxID=104663 RepID=A0A1G7LPQ9_CHIFI|nr:hypothetical protein [Chitinophaga filiformis]SDF51381.1 hypothetical protein SAMN04488121_102142 [Chitinophaga filiformis]